MKKNCIARLSTRRVLRLAAMVAAFSGAHLTVLAQTAPVDGIAIAKNLTIPSGGVWLPDSAGGHWWQTDSVLGICRVDPLASANPPWQLTSCTATAKSGGQAVIGTPTNAAGLPAGALYVFVADQSSKSNQLVRFVFNPAGSGGLSSPVTIQVPNVTSVGGGANGGRTVGLALARNGDLYVGYLKSGDLMRLTNANANTIVTGTPPTCTATTPSTTPCISKIGNTSDGRGINSLAFFHDNLYVSESGGNGLSSIEDPSGLSTRKPCLSSAPCTSGTVPGISSFPGGVAADGTFLYVADSPLTTPGRILQWNPVSGVLNVYSVNVPPYTSTFDGVTRNQYVGALGLGIAPNGDVYVGDDPTATLVLAVLPTQQGHLWKIPAAPSSPTVTCVTSIAPGLPGGGAALTSCPTGSPLPPGPASGDVAGGSTVIIDGTGFSTVAGSVQAFFGPYPAASVTCTSTTQCTTLAPPSAGPGTFDVRVVVGGVQSPLNPPFDQFTYTVATGGGGGTNPSITSITPNSGSSLGGTLVTLFGSNLTSTTGGVTSVTFGGVAATGVVCDNTGAQCTATTPPGSGTVTVTAIVGGLASNPVSFTYVTPSASLWAWGITAPKGGVVWVPDASGGHWWSSDHSNGFCRQDTVASTGLHAINLAVCDDGSIGSPGQAVYDARPAVCPAGVTGPCNYVYVPDNAVKSTAVWRLTIDFSTGTIVGSPEGMIPLADVRTLKPNGMALGPNPAVAGDFSLYVTDLTEMNIRRIDNPNKDPRTQTLTIVGTTGDGRGANGSIGFIGNILYISENRAASWIDVTQCPFGGLPCSTAAGSASTVAGVSGFIPLPSGAFVAGVAADAKNGFVYASDSPGGANATIWRYNVKTKQTTLYLQLGNLPLRTPTIVFSQNNGYPNQRPWDPGLTGSTAGFSFAFGIEVDPNDGSLFVTEDPTAGNRAGRGKVFRAPLVP